MKGCWLYEIDKPVIRIQNWCKCLLVPHYVTVNREVRSGLHWSATDASVSLVSPLQSALVCSLLVRSDPFTNSLTDLQIEK